MVAQIPADILLRLRTEGIDRELKKVEKRISKLAAAEKKIPKGLERRFAELNKELRERQKEVVKTGIAEKVNTRELKKQTAELAKQKKARGNRRQNALLGAGFPLLFGGGPAQALAGGIGGAIGGFSGGIALQAAVAGLGQLNNAITETAAVTSSTGAAYDFLKENQLFASEETRKLADELAELGRVEELALLVTDELVQKIGNEGVQNLKDLDSEWNQLLSNIAELGLAVASFIAKYLKPVIALLNGAIGNLNERNRFNALVNENAEAKAFAEELRKGKVTGSRRRFGKGITEAEIRAKVLGKFDIPVQPESIIPVTEADRERFAPSSGGRAAKVRESKVPALERELALKRQLFEIDGKIYDATVEGDKFLVARLEGEKELAKLAKDRADILAKDIPNDEKALELAINDLAVSRAKRDTEQELLDIKRKQQELIDDLVLNNQNQLALLQAETEYEKDLLRIKQKSAELSADGATAPQIAAFEASAKAVADLKQEQREYNELLKLAQGPANAFAQSLTEGLRGLVEGTMTAEEAFKNMLKGMADSLAQIATQMIAQYIAIGIAKAFAFGGNSTFGAQGTQIQNDFGNFFQGAVGARASGGPVNADSPYVVGENGAELFVPGKSGTIVNNDDFADAAAALAGASGAFAASNEAMEMAMATRSSNTAAAAEASAMQSADSYFSSGSSTISFDTYRVGEMDVVTREDAIKIGMQSAKQAEANVYKGLRNMPAIRGRSGVK